MIRKFIYGTPFNTEAVTTEIPCSDGVPAYGTVSTSGSPDSGEGFSFTYSMDKDDIVYGLGETNRGINKRGWLYTSDCTDDPNHTEDKHSLYGAHNFVIISGKETFGLFFDYPGKLTFDIGYTRQDAMRVSCENADLALYVIEGESAYDIVKQFRKIIGRSYIPPKFAFGFGQSRWGYKTRKDFEKVAEGYRSSHLPLDMIYMDIDYMEAYKDFTLNKDFDDFPAFVRELKDQHVRLVPIIDAGVKVEDGYDVYEEGVKNRYFCQREDGSDFVAAVWPGDTHFPDVLNPEARRWFGDKYRFLTDQGIEDLEMPYISDASVMEEQKACRRILQELNFADRSDFDRISQIVRELLGKSENAFINPPFYCDYGSHIEVGKNFFANYNCTIIDVAKVTIGNNCQMAPNVAIYTAGHPLHPVSRNSLYEYGISVTIGDNVWIGGNTVILPGVHIGSNTVIGAGSVVTKDIPDWVVAAGNPCRVIKKITENDKKYYYKDREFDDEAWNAIING